MVKYFKFVQTITDPSSGDETVVTMCFQKEGDKNKSIPEAIGNVDYQRMMADPDLEIVEVDDTL